MYYIFIVLDSVSAYFSNLDVKVEVTPSCQAANRASISPTYKYQCPLSLLLMLVAQKSGLPWGDTWTQSFGDTHHAGTHIGMKMRHQLFISSVLSGEQIVLNNL